MPYVTEIPNAVLALGGAVPLVTLPNTQFVNLFGPSQSFDTYDLGGGTNDGSLQQGDTVGLDNAAGSVVDGTYLGAATINNAAASVGVPTLANISLQINPIQGHLMYSGTDVYFISESPMEKAHLLVTASITVAGVPITVTGPISGIVDQLATAVSAIPLAGPAAAVLIRGVENTVQATLNTVSVTMSYNANGTLTPPPGQVTCYLKGTLIATLRGRVAIEDLRTGDLVFTQDRGLQPVLWIGRTRVGLAGALQEPRIWPVQIAAGALGAGMPEQDLSVSPQHRMLVRSRIAERMFGVDEVFVAAKHLVGLPGITCEPVTEGFEYYHLLLADHAVIEANGVPSESLYTGEMALAAMGPTVAQAVAEKLHAVQRSVSAMPLARRSLTRKEALPLLDRHQRNGKALVQELGSTPQPDALRDGANAARSLAGRALRLH